MTPDGSGAARATVLVVDDERGVTEGLTLVLRRQRYEVLAAQSGQEALSVLARKRVDVIVSDHDMPGMSGSELLAIVSREFPGTARIVLTGKATVDTAAAAINDGRICRFLFKPCKPADLVAAVEGALSESAVAAAAARLLEVARQQSVRRWEPAAAPGKERVGSIDPDRLATLSLREREVFDLLVDGLRVSQIAKALFIAQATVRNHVKAIFQKLDVHSQQDLVAMSRGLPR